METKKNILVIYTGGTICTAVTDNTKSINAETAYSLNDFYLNSNSECKNNIELHKGQYFGILSENMTIKKWNEIIKYFVKDVVPNIKNYDGIILAHGTDSLAYSAALLSVLLKGIKIPVMLVSSNDSIANSDNTVNEKANGNDNFKTAVECIYNGLVGGVYVPYKNISDKKMYLHYGANLKQCQIYSEDFYSNGMIDLSNGYDVLKSMNESESTNDLLINEFKDKDLEDCVLFIEPYVGLNYDRFNFDGVKAVFHTTYHSGTACVERTKDSPNYTNYSILSLIDNCKNKGIDVYFSPSKLPEEGSDIKIYDSVPFILNHHKDFVKFDDGMTNELMYVKLLVAYSLNYSKKDCENSL